MKLVREILYEKFTDESDPIHDMGIGIEHEIRKFLKEINRINFYDAISYDEMLRYSASYKKLEFVKYLIESGKANINYNNCIALQWSIANNDIPMMQYLIDKGSRLPDIDVINAIIHQFSIKNREEIYRILKIKR